MTPPQLILVANLTDFNGSRTKHWVNSWLCSSQLKCCHSLQWRISSFVMMVVFCIIVEIGFLEKSCFANKTENTCICPKAGFGLDSKSVAYSAGFFSDCRCSKAERRPFPFTLLSLTKEVPSLLLPFSRPLKDCVSNKNTFGKQLSAYEIQVLPCAQK